MLVLHNFFNLSKFIKYSASNGVTNEKKKILEPSTVFDNDMVSTKQLTFIPSMVFRPDLTNLVATNIEKFLG